MNIISIHYLHWITLICAFKCIPVFISYLWIFCSVQLTQHFASCISSKISELLAIMENGLKNADPRDCTGYTGWAGENTQTGVLKPELNLCRDKPEPDPAPPKSDLAPHLGGSSSSRANERRLCWPIPCIYFMKNLLLWACLPHIYIWNNEFERAKKRDMTECDIHAFSFATLYIYLRQTDCAFENTHQGGHFDDCERASIEWLKNKSANYTFLWRCHDPIRQVKFVNCPETQVKVLEQRAAALVVQTRCADVKPLWESEREDAVQLN